MSEGDTPVESTITAPRTEAPTTEFRTDVMSTEEAPPHAGRPARVRRPLDLPEVLAALLRRWPVLVAVPLIAAGVTAGLYVGRPADYRSTATVVVPTASQGQATAPVFVAQAVSNFEGALRSDAVVHETSRATGVPAADVAKGLSVEQNGTSQLVEVSYTGRAPQTVSNVVDTAGQKALGLVVGGSLTSAEHQLDLANQAYADAEQKLSDFMTEHGTILPGQTFRRLNLRLLHLHDELGHAQAEGNDAEVSRLEAVITQKQTDLTNETIEYQRLVVDKQRAIDGLKAADEQVFAAKSFVATAESGSAISASPPLEVSRSSQLARRLVAVLVVALGLAIVFVVVLEFAVPRSAAGRSEDADDVRLPPEARGRRAR